MSTSKPPIWYWILSIIALLWNALGVMNYIQQAYRTEGFLEQVTTEQLAILDSRPAWATAVFAIAVFTGLLGSLLLLLRKKVATPILIISFVCAVATQIWWFTTDGPSTGGQITGIFIPVLVIVFAALLVWMSRKATANSWNS
ncbi:hypothetical protein RM697_08535 [Ichthyenterobacterium sp. W332]|uniref:Sugar transporter n=1 Tax=Microcosmobacter mediterraneus TaxID=3075607 RepID=A0ABU2YKM1_9FLAO|nr:hypothetical protein [Ichthyenterobacterium sp. W332]MDT0558691.1 hypothetical protein [Ichthyenterobacterium sp. W332]